MRKHKNIGAERSFLNKPFHTSLNSNISYTIVLETGREELINEDLYDYADVQFGISDCNRTIFLDFRIDTEEELENSKFKLDNIIKVCQKMKKDLDKTFPELQKGIKRKNEIENNGSTIKES